MIPKIVHILWYAENKLPNLFECILEENKNKNPDYDFKLWSNHNPENDIEELLKNEYQEIYEIFKKCKFGVQKADIARIVLLYHYGGIYIDLDILCLKPFDTLLDLSTQNALMAYEPIEQTKKAFNTENIICNAFMVSPPKHILFKKVIDMSITLFKTHQDKIFEIFNVFGSDLFATAMQDDAIFKTCKFFDRKLIYPINDPKFDDLSCSEKDIKMLQSGKYNDSYLVHYWIHSNFESKVIIEKFKVNKEESIHKNMYKFFKLLYPTHKYL